MAGLDGEIPHACLHVVGLAFACLPCALTDSLRFLGLHAGMGIKVSHVTTSER